MSKLRKILLLVTILGLLTACGNNADKTAEEPKNVATEQKETEEKKESEEKSQDKKEEEKQEEEKDDKDASEDKKTGTMTDYLGREIVLEKTPEKVICIGPGTLRVYSYVMGSDKVIGVEEMEKNATNRPYALAYPEFKELPKIGPGGPKNQPDVENLSFAQPDVVFSTYGKSAEELDELQKNINAPVVGISMGKEATFDPDMYHSVELIGKVMGKKDRANEVIDYMKGLEKDLKDRSGSIEDSPKVYAGCLSYQGNHDILWTRSNFNLFNAVNAKNIIDDISKERNVTLDKEKLLELNPEVIVIDLAGEELLKEDHAGDPEFYSKLDAFKNNKVFTIMPYNSYNTNIDTSMINMYYIGSVVHPDGFKDINISEKAAEIYTKLLGKDVYDQMLEKYPGGHKANKLGE